MVLPERSKHRAIDENFSRRIEELLYSRTDEKEIAVGLLRRIFAGRRFRDALDVGAGPGKLTAVLAEHADQLTLIEMLPEYRDILLQKFPTANIVVASIDHVVLDRPYNAILCSQVLYYFPEGEWMGLVRKLFAALAPGGQLLLILMRDSGDWWEIIDHYRLRLGRAVRFDYIPLTRFREMVAALGPLALHPFRCRVTFESEEAAVDAIGREVLQIADEGLLRQLHGEFAEWAQRFRQPCGEIVMHSECELLLLEKR